MVNVSVHASSFPRMFSWYLWLVCCGLVVCDSVLTFHDVTGYYVFHRVFDMTREESIPNWYASILLFCIGLTSLLIYAVQCAKGVRRSDASPWLFFSGFFMFLSMDDGAKFTKGWVVFSENSRKRARASFGSFKMCWIQPRPTVGRSLCCQYFCSSVFSCCYGGTNMSETSERNDGCSLALYVSPSL